MSTISPQAAETHSQPPLSEGMLTYIEDRAFREQEIRDGLQTLPPIVSERVTTYPALFVNPESSNHTQETNLIVVDVDHSGDCVGIGIVTHIVGSLSPAFFDKPFVGFTETEIGAQRQGLGRQRLLIMNDLSEKHFGAPLNSDSYGDTEPEARRIWLKLIREGRAEEYLEGYFPRYRFIATSH